jgi:hypothetical protein
VGWGAAVSYEGWFQLLCANGHLSACDAYEDPPVVCRCGASMVWSNSIDNTNGCSSPDDHSRVGSCECGMVDLEVVTPGEVCECPTCGVRHEKAEPVYKIPTTWGCDLRETR